MLGARAVGYFAAVGRVGGGFQKVVHAIDGVVQEVGVVRAYVDVNLAGEFRAQLRPVAFEDGFEIVVLRQ
jgi:hypothetical protein